ncbi:NAD-dependent epimerase/dehydratase family protein [Salegentibacter sp. JZCK2]|uniref:NAD-dependent epimerase/dehydratase family protein n=1 Tax=Salegentibacter tibetensis TaxID=2873600 RepID=UPI001CCC1F35|nr:NAD-dependent epimerase/dehydratase family protein [Salegentibacter tibetensis]MBZ9728113.1 NAD-dependent epimerase/dehydratase family protein [Salegentibacter tibetensis]
MTKRVLVTGASGFLGFHITKQLLQANYEVVALLRESSDTSLLRNLNCKIIRGNLSSLVGIEKAIQNCNFVIHAAAKTSQDSPDFEDYREANITSTKLLIEASKKHTIKRFVFVSSANSFTMGRKENPGTENSGFMPFLKNSGYAHSKYKAQQIVLKEARENRFPAIVVAPTFMVGPYDIKPSSGRLMLYFLKNKLVFYPKGGKSYVAVSAAATACINALQMGKTGESYLLSGVNLTYKEYFKKVAEISGESHYLIPLPKRLLKLIEGLYRIFPNRKLLLLKTNIRMLFSENYFNNKKAKEQLAMPVTNIDLSIKESIQWFQENKYI